MITFGEYVAYEKLQSKEEVKEWLHEENVYSNLENYESLAEELCDFKDTIKRDYNKNLNTKVYKNIYAHELTIMLPLDIDLDNKKKFVEHYMKALDYCYSTKYYLYCYKFVSEGNGSYAKILCFTRKIYKRKQKKLITYNSDYYWNDETKKRCSKKDPNAILLHKKGDPKLDKEGNQIYQYFFCSPVEKEIFKYTSFNKFLKMLKKCVEYVKRTLLKAYNKRRFFSYITTPKKVSILSKRKITIKNQLINTLNREMYNVPSEYFDDSVSHMGFNKIFDRDNYLLRKSYYRMIKKIESALRSDKFENPYSNEVIDLSLYQNFAKYRENLNELENVLMSIINDWFDKEFYPYHDVLQSLVICGIDYERLIEISLMQTYGNLHSFTAVKNVVYQQIQEMARMTNKNIWLQETGIFNNYGFETTWVLGSKDSGKAFVFSDEQRARIQYELLSNNI